MTMKEAAERTAAAVRFVEITDAFASVDWWLHPLEGFALMEVARLGEGTGQIVEIGSFKGRSTCWLALGARDGKRGPVYAIDPFTGSPEHQKGGKYEVAEIVAVGSTFPAFEENLRRMGLIEHVRPIKLASLEAAKQWKLGAIRLLFIDGDHSYEVARSDIANFAPLVEPGGYIVIDDAATDLPGSGYFKGMKEVSRACRELERRSDFVNVLNVGHNRIFRRLYSE